MPTDQAIMKCIEKLRNDAEAGGYNLNPNLEDLKMIIAGYLENDEKFGYPGCPCRLNSGNFEEDKDIICPCVYREPDVKEYGSCYCNLYVSQEWNENKISREHVPERRPIEKMGF